MILSRFQTRFIIVPTVRFASLLIIFVFVVDMERAQMSFANKQPPKKKRKSRTAFTNHQIFELEKRFLYQKYLSPADRDEIAASLGLSNAQVRRLDKTTTNIANKTQ